MPKIKTSFTSLQLFCYYQHEIIYTMQVLEEEMKKPFPFFSTLYRITQQVERNKILMDFWFDKNEENEKKFKGKDR